jgi:hypothetical protein
VPRITDQDNYGAALEKVARLGLTPVFEELKGMLTSFTLLVKEQKDANGGAAVRKMIDQVFEVKPRAGWIKRQTGDVDWTKCRVVNGTKTCMGVEVQFSGRSDLIVVDIIHLRRALTGGLIDVGVLVVPNDRLGPFLVDRGPRIADARRHIREARAEDLPIVILGLESDGPGPPLPKQVKRVRKQDRTGRQK